VSYVAKRKRVVKLTNGELDFGDFYLTDFITPNSLSSTEVVNKAWYKLVDLYKKDASTYLSLLKVIGLYNMYVKELWNVVNVEIKYRYDDPVFQTPDFWLLPNETWKQRFGDCEDTTFLLLSAIYAVKRGWESVDEDAKNSEEYGCLGFYRDVSGGMYGHGFIIRKSPRVARGRYLWVETTLESEIPQHIWYAWNPDVLIPVYFFTDRETYRIDKDYSKLGLTQDYVSKYKNWIDLMIQYVEIGKWLPVKWMHKTTRPAKPTEAIYIHTQ